MPPNPVNNKKYFWVVYSAGGLVILIQLSACSVLDKPRTLSASSERGGIVGHTAETRNVHIIMDHDGQVEYSICAEPPPDVAKNAQDGMSFSLRVFNQELRFNTKDSTTGLPLKGRNGYVMLARELNHWLCTAAHNMDMKFHQVEEIYQVNIKFLKQLAAQHANNSKYNYKQVIQRNN
jgi:hypothetical protein